VFKHTARLIAEIEALIEKVRANHAAEAPRGPVPDNRPGTQRQLPPPSEADTIFIPANERGRLITSFPLSVRLAHVLATRELRLLRDIHGLTYGEIRDLPNCGKKTVDELRSLVRELQSGAGAAYTSEPATSPIASTSCFTVSTAAQDLCLSDLPLSARLENVLAQLRFKLLGDLNGVEVKRLTDSGNCGRKSILELQSIISRANAGEFSVTGAQSTSAALHHVASLIDIGLEQLSQRDRTIFENRLSGKGGAPKTLEEVAIEFHITRERVRQIVKLIMSKLRRGGGPKLSRALQVITQECEQRVCPLTPQLFAEWLDGTASALKHEPVFYVRVLDTMEQAVPAWPPGSTREGADDPHTGPIQDAIEKWLRLTGTHAKASDAYTHLLTQPRFKKVPANTFLGALRIAKRILLDFPEPDQPQLRLRRLQIHDFARAVLTDSATPLTSEEIVERAKARYGENAIVTLSRNTATQLSPELGFFLLGPRSFGLRQHFQTPQKLWPKLRNAFAAFLRQQNRPISTIEAVGHSFAQDLRAFNSYEMAQVIREDQRFTDLGRRLFGLAEWGIQERQYIKDLLPRVFREAQRALTVGQTLERLTRLRSVSPYSITNYLQKHPEIRSFGFGYYGLKEWGDAERRVILTDRIAVERAVRRAPQPVSFEQLCTAFAVPAESEEAGLLWKSCAGSPKLRRAPDAQKPETLLLHKCVSLEQCLANISRTLQRPAPAYELQWELNSKFGELFSSIGLSEMEQRLRQSQWFLRNAADQFLLDEDFNTEAFDADALRAAAVKSLADSKDIAGCDELLERLEAQGFELDELSEEMLASILRGAEGLQEVAQRRFRAI
jgi:hypothetical protein